jgi:hypothetical protein
MDIRFSCWYFMLFAGLNLYCWSEQIFAELDWDCWPLWYEYGVHCWDSCFYGLSDMSFWWRVFSDFVLMKSNNMGIEWWYTHYKGSADIFYYMGMDISLSGIGLLTSSFQTASWQRGKFMASVWPSGKTKACFTPWSFLESARIRWQGPEKGD